MRGRRAAAALVAGGSVAAVVVGLGVGSAGERPAGVAVDEQGCPVETYEASEEFGWAGVGPWPVAYRRALAEEGADHAVLCARGTRSQGWEEPLRIKRGIRELEGVLRRLPRATPGGISPAVGYPPVNLVLHYPDGGNAVLSFEFNRDEVAGERAVRSGAGRLQTEFARIWRIESVSAHPEKIEPVACAAALPDPRKRRILPAAPLIPGGQGLLPVPLAVVSACRYTADGGELKLRRRAWTRDGLEWLRTDVRARPEDPGEPRCGVRAPITALDVLHLTDVTARTRSLVLLRVPCEGDSDFGYPTGRAITPGVRAVLADLLG